MKVLVTDNAHLYKAPDGNYYTPTIYGYEFFQRYLNVFDEVRFVSKTKYMDKLDTTKYLLVSGKGLEIYELPWYQGIKGMFKNIFTLIARYQKACDGCDCFIFRAPQIESYLTYIFGNRKATPYAVEVVVDPASFTDVKGVFKWLNIYMLKFMVRRANGVSYVTQNYLQQRYPCQAILNGENGRYFTSNYSSIELIDSDIKQPKLYQKTKDDFEIIHVSNSVNSNAKGHITLLEAVKVVIDQGYKVQVCCVGEGSCVLRFKQYADQLGISEFIHFIGRLQNKIDVMNRLSRSSLFVFPTYTEGLPRCVIEAQAVGLPCLSTPVAGIPELIDRKYLFAPDDSMGFAKEIIRLIDTPKELEEMSKRNIEIAQKYTKEKLTNKRNQFYEKLRNLVVKC